MTEERPSIAWAGVLRDIDVLAPHYAVCGVTGSGKTLLLRTMMQTALVHEGRLRYRSLIFDPKLEFYPLLRGMGVPADAIKVLNPFDQRCCPWDIAADVTDEATAQALALIFIPELDRTNPFFETAVRQLVAAAITALHYQQRGKWTLEDLIDLCLSVALRDRLRDDRNRRFTGAVAEHLLNPENKSATEIMATFIARMNTFRPIASAWARSTQQPVSLKAWVTSSTPSILLLASDDARSASLDPLNRAIFARTAELITGNESPVDGTIPEDRTWIFLDELRLLGRLHQLDRLLLKGRSKGAHVVLAFQDVLGLEHVYGKAVAREMVGQCANMAFLRILNPETRAWASATIGESMQTEDSTNLRLGKEYEVSTSTKKSHRPIAHPTTFLSIPPPREGKGMAGIFLENGFVTARVPETAAWEAPGLEARGKISDDFLRQCLSAPSRLDSDRGVTQWTETETGDPPRDIRYLSNDHE